jgi:hypothetical protein
MSVQAVNKIIGQYQISKGIEKRELKKLASNKKVQFIQFASPLTTKEIELLENIVFSERPDISLRVYGHYSEKCDLSFIKRIPSLKKFSADCLLDATGIENVIELSNLEELGVGIYNLDNFDFLDQINPNLKELYLHRTKSKKPKISSISRFADLEYLYLEGQQKGIEKISELKKLRKIVLRSISTKNLDFLRDLNELWFVDIKLGGIQNFNALKTLPKLKYLELWQIRNLSDLSFISSIKSLQNLFIQSLKQVTELPNFENNSKLRRIYLENLKSLTNLNSLKNVPNLKELVYVLAENQEPGNLIPALENKSLESIFCRFGSDKKNNRFDQLAMEYNKSEYKYSEFKYE